MNKVENILQILHSRLDDIDKRLLEIADKLDVKFDLKDKSVMSTDVDGEYIDIRQLLNKKLVNMGLSVRSLNRLKSLGVYALGDLVSFNKGDLLKIRDFGGKCMAEIEELVESKGLVFGMDVYKYWGSK